MLVNLREFFAAVTKEDYKGNTSMAVRALMRWDIPMVIRDNLPNGARKHRRVDIAHVEKARIAYLREKEVEERAKTATEVRVPAEVVLKKPPKRTVRVHRGGDEQTPLPLGSQSNNLGSYNNMRAQVSRIEQKVDALMKLWGAKL